GQLQSLTMEAVEKYLKYHCEESRPAFGGMCDLYLVSILQSNFYLTYDQIRLNLSRNSFRMNPAG
ncbi:MAG: hypothetical protein KAX39_04400, partial [candidate division Zixibacteria bacterium]|nr:hypothetical protein [candidate division Zixibacteria bacterium]